MKIIILALIILSNFLTIPVFADEYWLEPDTFFPAPGQKTALHLYVGNGLFKDLGEYPFKRDKTRMFQQFSTSKTVDLKKSLIDGALPVYHFSASHSGNFLLAMEREWVHIKLDPLKFEDYLREDGIEYIIAEREKLGESLKEGRERYSRYIKSLLQVGEKRDAIYKKSTGLRLEIIPLENPYSKMLGDELNFQVAFEGKPLVGKAIFGDSRSGATQKMITDHEGKVTLKIDQSGFWLMRLVYMQRCVTSCEGADWDSFWGAFSFGVK